MTTTDTASVNPPLSVIRRAANGDESAIVELREVLENREVADLLGNLSRRIEGQLIESVAKNDPLLREALPMKLQHMRREIAGPNPTPLELQLVERVVLCWLTLHEIEHRFNQMKELPPKQAEAWQRRIDQAHRRYLAAVKMLATVRKLAIPVIIRQLRISQQQVTFNSGQSSSFKLEAMSPSATV